MILNVQTIPNGFILREEELYFTSDEYFPNMYSITTSTNFVVNTSNGLINFVITDMSCDGIQYNTPEEFITALGL